MNGYITNQCHICLDEFEDIDQERLIKECCPAYICNPCWINLLNNDNTIQCPICQVPFPIEEIISNEVDNVQGCRETLRKSTMPLKWLLIGYIFTNIIVFLIFGKKEYFESMVFLNNYLYFWPICLCYGYFIVSLYEMFSGRTCQEWYPQ